MKVTAIRGIRGQVRRNLPIQGNQRVLAGLDLFGVKRQVAVFLAEE